MKHNEKKISRIFLFAIISLLISFIITSIFFLKVSGDKFLFVHDEYLLLNKAEAFKNLFAYDPINLGLSTSTFLVVTFFDKLFYEIIYNFNLKLQTIQFLLYYLKNFLLVYLPLVGFFKLSEVVLEGRNTFKIFFISLWYSFNTYTLIYWHGNAFSLTLLITYSLAPLALAYYHKAIFNKRNFPDLFMAVFLIFLMSFGIYLFAVFALFLFLYTVFYVYLHKDSRRDSIKNFIFLAIIYLPLLSVLIPIVYDTFINLNPTANLIGGETYGSLKGGLLYQFLLWFSWGIYTYWQPRNIYTFSNYFKIYFSLLSPFILYGIILYGTLRKKVRIDIITVLFVIFLFFLLMVKGAQAPFGEVFLLLIKKVPLFRIFRSPDNKFGFGIIFTLGMLLLMVSEKYKRIAFISLLAVVIVIQGYLIFNGKAIIGENTNTSSDRIISVPSDYSDLTQYINKNTQSSGYVLSSPPINFAIYNLSNSKRYVGQDLLPKLSKLPFIYLSRDIGISNESYKQLSGALNENKVDKFNLFPIQYILLRNDIATSSSSAVLKKSLSAYFPLVFKNKLFDLYENPKRLPMISSPNITFTMINPTKYYISFKSVRADQILNFYQSYNSNWKLYPYPVRTFHCYSFIPYAYTDVHECIGNQKFEPLNDMGSIFQKSAFDKTHSIGNAYANTWRISVDSLRRNFGSNFYSVNPDGSLNFALILYFKTQAIAYLSMAFSLLYLSFLIILFFYYAKKNKKV